LADAAGAARNTSGLKRSVMVRYSQIGDWDSGCRFGDGMVDRHRRDAGYMDMRRRMKRV
jgi:hypothetical protein